MRQQRIGVALSLALHALVAIGVSRFAWRTLQPEAKPTPRVVWLSAPPPTPVVPVESDRESGPQRPSSPNEDTPVTIERESEQPAAPTDRTAQPEPAQTQTTQPPAPARRPLVDLSEARQQAIDTVLKERERGSSYLSFTFPGTLGEQQAFDESERHRRAEAGLQAPLTAFDSPSKGRAGLDEQSPLGQYTRWVSDDCYQTFGTDNLFVLPIAQGLYSAPTTNCMRVQPRDDLFANAKPAYLMDADERAAANERHQRIERLRRPTTGAVMSLED